MTRHVLTRGFLLIHHHINDPCPFRFKNSKRPGVIQDVPDHRFPRRNPGVRFTD
jgi:hypothetical protein